MQLLSVLPSAWLGQSLGSELLPCAFDTPQDSLEPLIKSLDGDSMNSVNGQSWVLEAPELEQLLQGLGIHEQVAV